MPRPMIMLDLETAGQGPNAAIVAIGACNILPAGPDKFFYHVVDLESSMRNGGIVDAGTFKWWTQQSEAARAVFKERGNHILETLDAFDAFIRHAVTQNKPDDVLVWGNGSDFDNVILSTAYQRASLPLPWEWWNNRCYRTMKKIFRNIPESERHGTKHNALDDAIHQAKHLAAILKHIDEISNPPVLVDMELVGCKE